MKRQEVVDVAGVAGVAERAFNSLNNGFLLDTVKYPRRDQWRNARRMVSFTEYTEPMIEGCDAMGRALSGGLRGGEVYGLIYCPPKLYSIEYYYVHCVFALYRV